MEDDSSSTRWPTGKRDPRAAVLPLHLTPPGGGCHRDLHSQTGTLRPKTVTEQESSQTRSLTRLSGSSPDPRHSQAGSQRQDSHPAETTGHQQLVNTRKAVRPLCVPGNAA